MKQTEMAFLAQMTLGIFSVDEQGRVWRHARFIGGSKIGSPSYLAKRGATRAEKSKSHDHLRIMFTVEGKRMAVYAHRIVWIVANKNTIPEGIEVNHKDGNPQNNHPSNLELATKKENANHAAKVLKRFGKKDQWGEKNTSAKLTPAKVLELYRLCNARAMSQGKIAELYGMSQASVNEIYLGKTWKHLPRE